MQRYDIFNKHNRVCIVNASSARFVSENERVMECDEKNVDSIDFARFFKEKCRENITIIVKSLTVKEVFDKAIEGLVFVQAAGGLVRNERGEYLFIYRSGHWDLPKGHWEEGEKLDYTAVREVEEETGLKNPKSGEKLGITYHVYSMNGRREIKETHWYDMRAEANELLVPQKEEGIECVEWLTKERVESLGRMIYPSLRHFLTGVGFSFD